MYNIIKSVIESKNYELNDISRKIDKRCIEGVISEDQRDELITLAREGAKAENSYAPLQEQIEKLASDLKELKAVVDSLKNGGSVEVEPTVEYPEYVQPTGGHDAYKVGDKVTFEGKKYECLSDGCVWTPYAYPQGWKEITE